MNIHDLTLTQLKRAVALKGQISKLGDELRGIFDGFAEKITAPKKRTMNTSAKRKIAAAQRARWTKLRRGKAATRSAKPAGQASKKKMSPAARAKLSAKLKAYWAAKKKGARR